MGFNTNITICNDNLSDYRRNPQRFADVICDGAARRDGVEVWGITVVPTDHADATQLIAAGGNFATKVHTAYYVPSHHTADGQVAILRSWAESLGYELRKKAGS
ncbi:hypothetical protein [Mycobacterium malmoense]|uniref:hypothetical protein n=1 Tax=Mycobacterium malmoense TaxID=1780 RepID=UPI0009F3A661|nr:hypothetical protein [Mycobacterium malmoense]